MPQVIQAELMLLSWAETSNGGAKVVFQLADTADLEPFKSLTLAKGKQAGQRFMGALALIEDDAPAPEKGSIGARCQLAVRWCDMPEFWLWLDETYPETTRECGGADKFTAPTIMRTLLGVKSRAEIDVSLALEQRFDELFRGPFSAHLRAINGE